MSVIEQQLSALNPFPPLQPPQRYLFGPGPSMVHPRVYEALAKPIVGHLDPYFIQIMGDIQQLLKTVYGTNDGTTIVITGSEWTGPYFLGRFIRGEGSTYERSSNPPRSAPFSFPSGKTARYLRWPTDP